MRQGRIYVALCILAGVWIAVYWLWDGLAASATTARVTFATSNDQPSPPAALARDDVPDDPPAQPAITPIEPTEGVIAPAFESYVIERGGMSWDDVSIAVYGEAGHGAAIADANPFVVSLTVGKEVRYPLDPGNTRGVPIEAETDEEPPYIAEHTVASGEVLSEISRKYYGTVNKWREILEFNRERLKLSDERDIRPGQVLQIPRLD